jgi:hypothetical protein
MENHIISQMLSTGTEIDIRCEMDARYYGFDFNILNLVFGDFERIEVGQFGFHIRYSY